jgi:hypothetical protein
MEFLVPLLRGAAQLIGSNPIVTCLLGVVAIIVTAMVEAHWWQALMQNGVAIVTF